MIEESGFGSLQVMTDSDPGGLKPKDSDPDPEIILDLPRQTRQPSVHRSLPVHWTKIRKKIPFATLIQWKMFDKKSVLFLYCSSIKSQTTSNA